MDRGTIQTLRHGSWQELCIWDGVCRRTNQRRHKTMLVKVCFSFALLDSKSFDISLHVVERCVQDAYCWRNSSCSYFCCSLQLNKLIENSCTVAKGIPLWPVLYERVLSEPRVARQYSIPLSEFSDRSVVHASSKRLIHLFLDATESGVEYGGIASSSRRLHFKNL